MSHSILLISNDKNFQIALKEQLVNYKTFHFNYDIDALIFSKSCDNVDVVIFDYEKINIDIYAYIVLINSLLEKNNPAIIRIVNIDPNSLENEYVKKLPFKSDFVMLPRIEYSSIIKTISQNISQAANLLSKKKNKRRYQLLNRKPLSSLPESKSRTFSDFMISVQISKEGIDSLLINFERPASLNQLVKYSELLPVAYLEKYSYGTKIEKSKVLGIDRMKYARLSKAFEKLLKDIVEESDDEINNIFTKI